MTESSRLERKYRKLVTDMNVPKVDDNLYMKSLRNRYIPYNTRLSTFDRQKSKTVKPKVPPRPRSSKANYKQTTVDLSVQLPTDRNEFLTLDQTFRQRSPSTPLRRPKEINWTSDQVNVHRAGDKFSPTQEQKIW